MSGASDDLSEKISALQREVQALSDRESIRKVKLLYCRLADNGRYDEFEQLFDEDFTCEIYGPPPGDGSPPNVLRFPSKRAWMDFVRASGAQRARVDATGGREGPSPEGGGLPGTAGWNPGAAHHMHIGEIEFTGPDSARAIWPSQFDSRNGYYDEEYRRVNGEWKIAREKFFAQARREYSQTDYPYALEFAQTRR